MSDDGDGICGLIILGVIGLFLYTVFNQAPSKNEVLMKICGDGTRIIANTKTGKMYASGTVFSQQVYSEDVCGR